MSTERPVGWAVGERARAWLVLARPRLLPAVLALVGLGFGWAHWNRALPLTGAVQLAWVLVAWTLLHAGTLWLNAALDQDEGPVLLGKPMAAPPGTVGVARLALLAALLVVRDSAALLPMAGCVVLAELYSHPKTAWKAHPWLGPLVNVLGYGLWTPLAGWSVVGAPPDVRSGLMASLVAVAVLGCFFVAQAFQGDEDRARGYRTLVATGGARATLIAARLCFAVAFGGVAALAVAGWLPRGLLVLLGAALWVDRALRRGQDRPDGGGPEGAVEVGRRLAWSAALGMMILLGGYVRDGLAGAPVAGLATAGGHPHPNEGVGTR